MSATADNQGEPITEEGLAALKAELGSLETVARREIAERILVARGHGDLKENAEYHAAKEDQAHLETRILRLRQRLRNAVVTDAVETGNTMGFARSRRDPRPRDRRAAPMDDRRRRRSRPRRRQALRRVPRRQGAAQPARRRHGRSSTPPAAPAASASNASSRTRQAGQPQEPCGAPGTAIAPESVRRAARAPGPDAARVHAWRRVRRAVRGTLAWPEPTPHQPRREARVPRPARRTRSPRRNAQAGNTKTPPAQAPDGVCTTEGTGGDLLSQALAGQVPSALRGLTALFGKGRGVSPSL